MEAFIPYHQPLGCINELKVSKVNNNEEKYTGLLYNGFYVFELLSERNMDDVICGICGVVGQVYFGDGNEKNCCSIDNVK